MKTFLVELQGVTPYMQHRMDTAKLEEWEKSRKKIIERPDIAQEDAVRAEYHCYRNADNSCYVPSAHILGALINAGTYMKAKVGNARKSMKNIVAAMFDITPEEILIPDYDQIDKRSAVNHNVKGRIITIRPKWSTWKIKFKLLIDDDTMSRETVMDLLIYAGKYCGIGSYRPTNSGHFGRFEIKTLKEIKK